MSEILQTVQQGRLLRVILNRPEKRNALNSELCCSLVDALERADADPGIGAILLTGNGKSFCAGMDLAEVTSVDTGDLADVHERLFTIGARMTKPLIAGVQGAALAGGTGLVANCHIAIAEAHATFGLTEIRIGLWPFLVYRAVCAAIGDRRTLDLALTGRIISAREAYDFGLVGSLGVDAEKDSLAVAQALAASSRVAIETGMRYVRETKGMGWEAAGAAARRVRDQVFASPEFQEGIRAFLQNKGKPEHQATKSGGSSGKNPT